VQQLIYAGARELRWVEAEAPRLTSDAAAVVRPLSVATCDLDALILAGASPFEPPFPVGHECVAEIVELGDAVGSLHVGQRVVVPFQISCGTCPACCRGHTSNCRSVPRASTYGFGPQVGVWGGFLSDLVPVPFAEHMLVPVPGGVASATVASASDNIGDAWRCVGPALQRDPDATVLVVGGFGPGSIGLYATAIAAALGARRVVYADRDRRRCEVARVLGAEVFADERPRRLGPFSVTVDAAGDPTALAFALRSTAPDGECTSAAIYFGAPPELPLLEMYEKVVTFRTGRSHARPSIPPILELVSGGELRPDRVTSRTVGWAEAIDALLELDWTKLVIERPSQFHEDPPVAALPADA
jgi:alcohol dehydrogenase